MCQPLITLDAFGANTLIVKISKTINRQNTTNNEGGKVICCCTYLENPSQCLQLGTPNSQLISDSSRLCNTCIGVWWLWWQSLVFWRRLHLCWCCVVPLLVTRRLPLLWLSLVTPNAPNNSSLWRPDARSGLANNFKPLPPICKT